MAFPKLTVFVSATTSDLTQYRQLVEKKLRKQGILAIIQDDFPPDYNSVVEMLRNRISECDAVICLIGKVFGAAPRWDTKRSYTQLEYHISRELELPVFVFLTDDRFVLHHVVDEDAEKTEIQRTHRQLLMDKHLVQFFNDDNRLGELISDTIPQLLQLQGNRSIFYRHLVPPPSYFAGRREEMIQLRNAIRSSTPAPIVVVGMGGQGKTTLVRQVVEDVKGLPFSTGYWCTASRRGFTFDHFLDDALIHLDRQAFDKRKNPDLRSRLDRLLTVMQARPLLVIIDAIDHWLSEEIANKNYEQGMLTSSDSQCIQGLLQEFLSDACGLSNGSHLLITTRVIPRVLDQQSCAVIPVRDPGISLGLDGLDDESAVSLLTQLGVRGPVDLMKQAANAYINHPLFLRVLAGMLVQREGGRIEATPSVSVLDSKQLLHQLLEHTSGRLPGGEKSQQLLQIIAHFHEDAPVPLVHKVLVELKRRTFPMKLFSRFIAISSNFSSPSENDIQELAINLGRWNLLYWDGCTKRISLHALVKDFYLQKSKHSDVIHHLLADIYAAQPIKETAATLRDARTRKLAIEHSLSAGDIHRCYELMFSSMVGQYNFSEWLEVWGHFATGAELLGKIAESAAPVERVQILSVLGSMQRALGLLNNANETLDLAVELAEKLFVKKSVADSSFVAGAYLNRGNLKRQLKQTTDALFDYQRAIAVLEQSQEPPFSTSILLANSYSNHASALRDLGALSKAISEYDKSIQELTSLRSNENTRVDFTELAVRLNRGIVLGEKQEWELAFSELTSLAECYETEVSTGRVEFESTLAYVRSALATTLNDMGRSSQAISQLNVVVATLNSLIANGRTDLEDKLALAFLNRAQAHTDRGCYDAAESDGRLSHQIYERLVDEGRIEFKGQAADGLLVTSEALFHIRQLDEDISVCIQAFEQICTLIADGQSIPKLAFIRRSLSIASQLIRVQSQRQAGLTILQKLVSFAAQQFETLDASEAVVLELRRWLPLITARRIWNELPRGDQHAIQRIQVHIERWKP